MDAKAACLVTLLFSYLSSQTYASFPKIKHNKENKFDVPGIKDESQGSNLSIDKSKVLTELYHSKTIKFPATIVTEKIIDNFHGKATHDIQRRKREEGDTFDLNALVQNTSNAEIPSTQNQTTTPAYSEEFLRCGKIPISVQYYTKFENGTVYVPFFDMYFSAEHYIIDDKQQELLICPNFFPRYEYSESEDAESSTRRLQIASLACSCLSTAFMALFIVVFVVDKDMRTLPSSCVLCLCSSQIVAYSCSFGQYYIKDEFGCTVIGIFTSYFFLASFFWMNVLSYDIWKSVRRSVVELRLCTGRSIKRQLSIYSFYAWGAPLAIAAVAIAVHLTTADDRFRLVFRLDDCWFERAEALWLYFAGPVLILLASNFLSFAVVFCLLQRASSSYGHSGFKGMRTDLKSRFVLGLKLNSVMGLTWLIGVAAELADQEWLRYPYVVLSALQGFFIFFSYVVNTKTKRIARGFLEKHRLSFPGSLDQTKSTRL